MTKLAVRRSAFALGLARPYTRWRLRRDLDGVWTTGLDSVRRALSAGPLLLAGNHVAWWDALLLVALDEALGAESAVLMDADNLARLPWMARLGAISLHRGSGASARAGLRAGADWLDRPGRILFVFPQGKQRPAHLRPLGFERGVELVCRMSGAPVHPFALQYGFREQPQPAAALAFGAPCAPHVGELETRVTSLLAELDPFFEGRRDLDPLIATRLAQTNHEGLGPRLLTQLTGGGTP